MISNTQSCRPEQFEAFLSGELQTSEEEAVLQHLDECQSCRQRLDEIAAAPDSWNNAQAFLADDQHDRDTLSGVDAHIETSPQIAHVLETLRPTDDPAMLGRIGGYEVSGVVGAGGMGVVLKAFDGPLDRTVAIKVMAPHLATSGAARHRFSREARAAAAGIQPNVTALHGVSTDAALPYLVLPYDGGASLQKRLDEHGNLPVADVLRIAQQIAAGLAAAHDQGLVHRDIKPANILLEDGVDRLVITDFGLARAVDDASVTRTGVIAGTPQYMSPEQARGESVDSRSDLFSLGSVMYAMCTGRVPFRADSPYGVLRRITDNTPREIREINVDIPPWMCRIVERLHAKMPGDRFGSAQEVEALLTQCIAHVSQPTVNPLPEELETPIGSRQFVQRWWKSVAFIAALVVLLPTLLPDGQSERSPPPASATLPMEGPVAESVPAKEPAPQDAIFPWDSDNDKHNWDDNLDDILRHIEQSLEQVHTP